ncbi:MAG: excinuclease ABC subunit UvrC [Ruminococcaceae bacterium]|nr:excinuclease ABC subunit UvrC [Oscillospiraceae bacterium]
MNERITSKLKTLPDSPGVYIMRDADGTIIYVGKAKILKNRVRQYFHGTNHTPKVAAMIEKIEDFEYILTDTEFEALCLESNLIKTHKPRYNILLKDDKGYPFIKITAEDYPRITLARKKEADGAQYFGPYPSSAVVYETLDVVRRIFSIQHCNKKFPAEIGRTRPCLYHAMHRCSAPCTGQIPVEAYRKTFEEITRFLNGDHTRLIRELEEKMEEAATDLAFEAAAAYRDKIEGIRRIAKQQKVITGKKDADIFALALEEDLAVFAVFFIRGGKLLGSRLYRESGGLYASDAETLADFVQAYYSRDVAVPSQVYTALPLPDATELAAWLTEKREKTVHMHTPQRGELRQLCDMAAKNCAHALETFKIDELRKTNRDRALSDLQEEIGMEKPPVRIEAYDISNTGGSENVGSMVVFLNGKKAPAEYKRFKIKYIIGSNDYDCMKEVLSRRFLRYHGADSGFSAPPDLILVDGGLGHVHAAEEILERLAISIPVLGMVKDDRHRTRGLIHSDGTVSLTPGSAAFRLVTLIQDEAHRFAISYHKNLRTKKTFAGELDGIRGVGPAKKKALMTHFKSITAIREATAEKLAEVKGIDRTTAENIYAYFKEKNKK